jgi:hypothetical protein
MALSTAPGDVIPRMRVRSRRMHVGVAAASLLVAWLAGCGPGEQEKLAGETVATMEELNKVLDGIKDEPTAKAAAPKVNELVDRWAGQMDRLRKLAGASAKPDDPPSKAVGNKYEERFKDAARGIGLNLMAFRLDIGIRRHLDQAITRYDAALKAATPAGAGAP